MLKIYGEMLDLCWTYCSCYFHISQLHCDSHSYHCRDNGQRSLHWTKQLLRCNYSLGINQPCQYSLVSSPNSAHIFRCNWIHKKITKTIQTTTWSEISWRMGSNKSKRWIKQFDLKEWRSISQKLNNWRRSLKLEKWTFPADSTIHDH